MPGEFYVANDALEDGTAFEYGAEWFGGLSGSVGGGSMFDASYSSPFASIGGFDPFTTIGSQPESGGAGGWASGLAGALTGVQIPIGGSSGPSTSEVLTDVVNAYERQLVANLANYTERAISADTALERGWSLMNQMVARLAQFGAEGQKAAAERDRRIDPARLRWDWIAYYLDPIIGGPVASRPLPVGNGLQAGPIGGNAAIGSAAVPTSQWLIVGAAVVVGILVLKR